MSGSIRNKIKNQKTGYGGTDLRKAFFSVSQEPLENAVKLPIWQVMVNPEQPRQVFNEERDGELAEDIQARGVLQPVLVRLAGEDENGNPTYQIIAGERRRRAAEKAGLTDIPAIICEVDEREARFISVVENLQRAELDPIDEKLFFERLQAEYNLGIKDIAGLIHKSETYVRNRISGNLAALNQILIEREELDSEISNNTTSEEVLLQNSHSQSVRASVKYNPGAFKRFISYTLESASQALTSGIDEKSKKTLKQDLEAIEQKIAELKSRL